MKMKNEMKYVKNIVFHYAKIRYIIKALKNPLIAIKNLNYALAMPKFVENLTEADISEINEYVHEIELNKEFNNFIEKELSYFNDVGAQPGGCGGHWLYALVRILKPEIVVETGVACGLSSAFILCALEKNKNGKLYSIDLPYVEGEDIPVDYFDKDGLMSWCIPKNKEVGWIIPPDLRSRWNLIIGSSSEKLPPLLEKLKEIDIFLHDSEHSYKNMMTEYRTAYPFLKRGGILLSHDIDYNASFYDFCRSEDCDCFVFRKNIGGLLKL